MTDSNQSCTRCSAAHLYIAAMLPLALLAWQLRFLVDDAFIAFRYADNWAAGLGPVYHAGELVEGYSDLAWVFLLSIAARLGAPLDLSAQLISVLCTLTTAALTVDVLRSLPLSKSARLAGALTVGLSANLAAWATGGLETALFTLALFGLWREMMRAEGKMWRAALFGALLVSARTEGALWLIGVGIAVSVIDLKRAPARLRLLIPGLFALALVLLWRHNTYGQWLPNTVHAKAGLDTETFTRGLRYVASWLTISLVPLAATVLSGRALRSPAAKHALAAGIIVDGGVLFAILTGGDWMPFFRFLAPTVPFLAILLAAGVHGMKREALFAWALPALGLLCAFDLHLMPLRGREALDFRGFAVGYQTELGRMDSARRNIPAFRQIGRALREHAGAEDSIVLGAIGAIGYESGLRVHDRNGLVDPEVASVAERISGRSAGHERRVSRSRFLQAPLKREVTWFGARVVSNEITSIEQEAGRQAAAIMMRNVIASDPEDAALLGACLPELLRREKQATLLLLRATEDTVAARAYWSSLGFSKDS
jgi:arabinofuranosyltransferase